MSMDHSELDWETLARLRNRFLENGSGPTGVYWQTEEDLVAYHQSFAARIGWKWDNALNDAIQAGFEPASRKIIDWGCGTGVASLKLIERCGASAFDSVTLWDHSTIACRFAQKTIQAAYPELEVTIASAPQSEHFAGSITLISHALNELTHEAQAALAAELQSAAQLFLVEPGDYPASRALISFRERFLDAFAVVAPCTHCDSCPMQQEDNAHHWCHFFGKPPIEAFTEGFWARFAQTLEIDLRSLPYSFLVLNHSSVSTPTPAPAASRLIGRPKQFKGYTRFLSCDTEGLRELELQKRDDKQLWKALKKGPVSSLFRWTSIDPETGRVKSGEAL